MFSRAKIWKLVVAAPLIAPVALAAFSVVTVFCMVVGAWNPYVIASLSVIAAATASYFTYRLSGFAASPLTREAKYAAVIVLLGATAWVVLNALFTSQNILMGRDAQIYAENAIWLVTHHTPLFEASEVFSNLETAGVIENQINRMMLLPYLMSLVGEVGGINVMLHVNPVFGGVAILAVFAFGRFLMRDRWAAVAAAAFSLTLPLIYFSRDNYTEPLAVAFIFGSLALLALAWQRKNTLLFAIAGLVAGSGMLVRFDSMMPVVGIVLAFILLLALTKAGERRDVLKKMLATCIGMALTVALGMINLMLFSWDYYDTHLGLIWQQFIALAGVAVLGAAAVLVCWKTNILKRLDKKTTNWRGWAVVGTFLAIVGVLASRPLWMTDRKEAFNGLVYSIETALGMVADGHRTYAEHTLNWIVWYVGPVLAIGAIAGIAILLYRAMYRRELVLFLSITVLLSAAVVYVNVPAITPDQIWASRRFLPVIFPAIILFGALFLDWLSRRKELPFNINSSMVVGILATLALLGPLYISEPFLRQRTHVPQLGFMETVCENIPRDSAVIWVGATAAIEMPQPTRTVCDVPSAAKDEITLEELRQLEQRARQHNRQLIVGVFDVERGLPVGMPRDFTQVADVTYEDLTYEMLQPPRTMRQETRTVFLGQVTKDGTIESLESK